MTDEAALRLYLAAGRRMLSREGAGSATFGLLAARSADGGPVLCTPSGAPEDVRPEDITALDRDAGPESLPGSVSRAASVALAILRRRPDAMAVVHTHSRALSILSTVREPVGMFNEMSTLFFGEQVVAEDDGDRSPAGCELLAAALGD
jgi:L-fuculose-phosphate aldolase